MDQNFKKKLNPEDGYQLWMRYGLITDEHTLMAYRKALACVAFEATSPTLLAARDELALALEGLLGTPAVMANQVSRHGTLVAGTPQSSPLIAACNLQHDLAGVGSEGYVIVRTPVHGQDCTAIVANTDVGVLYGVFHFLRHLQTRKPLDNLRIISAPKIKLRMLNHWDNLDGTIERGYAGYSLWDWHKLPDYVLPPV